MKNLNVVLKIDQSIMTNRTILTNLSNLDQEIKIKSSSLSNSSLDKDDLLEMNEFQSRNKMNNIKNQNTIDTFKEKIDSEMNFNDKKNLIIKQFIPFAIPKSIFSKKKC